MYIAVPTPDTEDVIQRLIIVGVILNFRSLTQEALSEVGSLALQY